MNTLFWIEELLPIEVISKKMPNGVGFYLDDKFILFLSEDSKTTIHKGTNYPFQLFFGVFFPIVKLKHNAVIAKFPFIENHPVKKEWLYIPAENENFEEEVKLVLREVLKKNPLFGIPVVETAAEKRAHKNAEQISDPRKPSLFNTDEPKANSTLIPVLAPRTKNKKSKPSKKNENALLMSMTKRRILKK